MTARTLPGRTIHVKAGYRGIPDGTECQPYPTIQDAANLAYPGDTVLVHEGIYRERVDPPRGGLNKESRITYTVAKDEHAVIKGSELIQGWKKVAEHVWQVHLPSRLFSGFNPYATPLEGDWLEKPADRHLNLGQVYLNGKALYQSSSLEEVYNPQPRKTGLGPDWVSFPLRHPDSQDTILQWYSKIDEDGVLLFANFQDSDPNQEVTEVNVRETCFLPHETGIDFITVDGFEMAQAACQWAPPTAEQIGIIGPHWSKGWIIANNEIHDAKCSGISLGTDISTGDNEATHIGDKPGYQYQLEGVFKARHMGWDKETIGSHTIINNIIHDCGQTGIVGNMGCINSIISHNHIFKIGTRYEFFGHEIAGIKLHAAIDTVIRRNNIHNCALGTWLDWQAQGTRVSSNIYHHNVRDVMIEVTHGPCLFDNNIFGSAYNLDNAAQGTAFVHNLFCGSIRKISVLDRFTPYHLPHSTKLMGTACVYGNDDRFEQNIFAGRNKLPGTDTCGTDIYDGSPICLDDFKEAVHKNDPGDVDIFEKVKQPVKIAQNLYFNDIRHFNQETDAKTVSSDPEIQIDQGNDSSVWLTIKMPELSYSYTHLISTDNLGIPRITQELFENPDSTPLTVDHDLIESERSNHPTPGPIENYTPGINVIRIF